METGSKGTVSGIGTGTGWRGTGSTGNGGEFGEIAISVTQHSAGKPESGNESIPARKYTGGRIYIHGQCCCP